MTSREYKYSFNLNNPVYYRRWFKQLMNADKIVVIPRYFYFDGTKGITEGVPCEPITVTITPDNFYQKQVQ